VLKATIEPGDSDTACPAAGDLVFLHYSLLDAKDRALESTRPECGGPGHPRPFVMGQAGRGTRPLRGFELALGDMRPRERCALQLKPEFAFMHKDCAQQCPPGLRREDPLRADVTLAAVVPGGGGAVRVAGDSGVIVRTLTPGDGWETPRAPFEVTLRLAARTVASDGTPSAGTQYYPAEGGVAELRCSLGDGTLPPWLDTAVHELRKGEEAAVMCPAALAAGGAAVPSPPPPDVDSCQFLALQYVEFTVTLVDFLQVRDLIGDGGAVKRTVTKGRGDFPADCPLEDTDVKLLVRVRSENGAWEPLPEATDAKDSLTITTGMGAVPPPVEAAARLMLRGEVALVTAEWRHAYGEAAEASGAGGHAPPPGVSPGSKVEFEVEMVDFVAPLNLAEASPEEKLAQAGRWREQGNALFRGGRYKLARQKYLKGVRGVDQALDIETQEQVAEASALKAACLVNLAACAQREEEWGETIQWCDKAIAEDETHVKAHFRRAVARSRLGQEEAAAADFETVKRLDPGAAAEVDRELAKERARQRAAAEKQRRDFRGFKL
jgi:FKBP-type peptidyl-prolyl cis-trans isomerase 2